MLEDFKLSIKLNLKFNYLQYSIRTKIKQYNSVKKVRKFYINQNTKKL